MLFGCKYILQNAAKERFKSMSVDIFDYLLAFTLVFLTWQLLRAKDLLTSIVLFIIFGIFIALAWVQLQAPDIALVEAVIGSALTGVLFLGCLGYIETSSRRIDREPRSASLGEKIYHNLFNILLVFFAFVLSFVVLGLPEQTSGLSPLVISSLDRSGADNPVTAVILNFRGYDTFLEIGVLLLVAIAVLSINSTRSTSMNICLAKKSRILGAFLYIITPLMVVFAFYLLWVGTKAPGGAFQAGAMLAGVGILMLIGGVRINIMYKHKLMRCLYALGFVGFLLAGVMAMGGHRQFLEFSPRHAKHIIFVIELLATISIACILLTLFAGCTGFLEKEGPETTDLEGASS